MFSRIRPQLVISCVAGILFVVLLFAEFSDVGHKVAYGTTEFYNALLIDEDCLRSLESNKPCGPSVTLAYRDEKAYTVKHKQKNATIIRYKDDPTKDYLLFSLKDHKRALVRDPYPLRPLPFAVINVTAHGTKRECAPPLGRWNVVYQYEIFRIKAERVPRFKTTRRLVALSDGRLISVAVPDSIPKFLRHWKRGRFMECKPVLERAGDVKRELSLTIVDRAAEFRDLCDEYGMTPFLACGSLLGWYRECSVIPHTQDFDFAAFREEHSEELDRLLRQSTRSDNNTFRLKYVYGRLHEAREYTVGTDVGRIDLFYMYPAKGQHYIAEMGFGRLQQLRYYYPKIEELCTGDLHGRLMFLPCNALDVIKVEHGEHWSEDIQSNKFYENRDHLVNNLKHVRYYASTEYPEVYQKY